MEKKVNALIGINVVLGIAVIALFVLFFSNNKPNAAAKSSEADSNEDALRIAYVNTDSILKKYELVKIMEAKLQGEGEAMQKELERRQQGLRQKLQQYQQQVKNNSISIEDAKRTEQALMQEEQRLYELQQEYANQYADQTMGMNQELVDTVKTFLNRYNKDQKYDYILAKSVAKNLILFSKDTFNITDQVVEKMNAEYRKKEK